MRILFILPYVPNRIRVRPFSFLMELAGRHEVHVIALGEGGGGDVEGSREVAAAVADLRVIPHPKLRGCAQAIAALPSQFPLCVAYCWSPQMQDAVRAAVRRESFDLVHIEHLRAAHFSPHPYAAPVVFDTVDCLAGLFAQMARSRANPVSKLLMAEETYKLRRYEPRTLRKFERVIATSESERDALSAMDPALKVEVVPNGVDTGYFAPLGARRDPRRIVFSGKMSYKPNAQAVLWFAANVLPAVRERAPGAEFVIVGSSPPPEVARLAQTPGVTVTGYVPDIRPYLDSAGVAVVPMQVAVGVQNKALEAMAMGLPVVASPTAARALGSNPPGVIVAGSADEMAAELIGLIQDPAEAARLGEQARAEVERAFTWRSSVGRLEEIYEEAVSERQSQPEGGL